MRNQMNKLFGPHSALIHCGFIGLLPGHVPFSYDCVFDP